METNGRKWARFGLIAGVVASIAGNVANACLTDATAPLLLRVVQAVIWPSFLFIGVEVLVRNRHADGWLARVGQAGLLSISVPTAITSYVNLHALMIKSGEPVIAQVTGPLAIDGLMLGCTIMLLAVRHLALKLEEIAPEEIDAAEERLEHLAAEQAEMDWSKAAEIELAPERTEENAPVSPAPETPSAPRAPRGEISPALRAAVEALILGERPEVGPGASAAVVGRYGKVLRTLLREGPNALIDIKAEKVRPELVDMLRSHAREVAPR